MGGGRWIEDPLYLLLSEEVVNLSQIPLLEGSTKLQLGTDEVGAVVRTDFNRFSATSDEALKGIYEGVRLKALTNFDVDGSGGEASEEASIPLEFTSVSFHKEWAKVVHAHMGKGRFVWCYTILWQVSHELGHGLRLQLLTGNTL